MLSSRFVVGLLLVVGSCRMDSVDSFSPTSSMVVGRTVGASSTLSHDLSPMSFSTTSTTEIVSVLDDLKEPIESYVHIWTPLFQQAQDAGLVPDFLLHWGHGLAMATVLVTMGVIGTYFGWQIRLGNGGEVNVLSMGETVRDAHPKIMAGALFFFLLGGQGGLVLYDFQGGDILQSAHATTALVAMSLMVVQAILPQFFSNSSGVGQITARDAHAYLGTANMAVLFAHLATGINLGLSF